MKIIGLIFIIGIVILGLVQSNGEPKKKPYNKRVMLIKNDK